MTIRLINESEREAAEENKIKKELHRAHVAEKIAKKKLLDFLSKKTSSNTVDTNADNDIETSSLEVEIERLYIYK